MKADLDAVLFSLKCLIAAGLAYYVALRIGLTRPYWALVTSYIIAQPLAGAVLSKAAFRLLGTLLGATAAVVLVPAFVNEPIALSAALACWLGLCLYLSLLDRTPRAYVFLLAGYTASIIALPSVEAPQTIFDTAILRVQEIGIGILSASLVHGLILPRSVTTLLLGKVARMLDDAERWSRLALGGAPDQTLDRERRRLAIDLADLSQLATHLPFDTARILPRARTLRALQDAASMLLPLAATVEDRLAALAACPGGVPAPITDLVAAVDHWLERGVAGQDRDATAVALIAQADAVEAATAAGAAWRDMLAMNLLQRLRDLIATHRDARALDDQLRAPTVRPVSPRVGELLAQASARRLHTDPALAVRAAFGTIATIALGCTFWIGSAWADGAGATLMAGIACALYSGLDEPARGIRTLFLGSGIGLLLAIFYAFAILPRATDYVTVMACVAPALLMMGALMGKSATASLGVGIVIGFPQSVGFNATYQGDFGAMLNGAIAQQIGIGFAMVTVGLFQTIGVEGNIARLVRAGWRDVALRAAGRAPDTPHWASRMLDRVGLLVPRLAARREDPGAPLLDVLADLRTGIVAGDLAALGKATAAGEGARIRTLLAGVARYFRGLDPVQPAAPSPALLAELDDTVASFAAEPDAARRREALVLLTSLRRNLFPTAPAYGAAA